MLEEFKLEADGPMTEGVGKRPDGRPADVSGDPGVGAVRCRFA